MIKDKEKIIRLISAIYPNVKIYLFGSRARGTDKESSDIDLAIDVNRKLLSYELAEAKNILEYSRIPQKIDLVDLNGVDEEFKKIILKDAILWKS